MNVKFRVSYKIGKKGTLVAKKKYLLTTLKSALCAHESILLDIELLIYFHRPKLI